MASKTDLRIFAEKNFNKDNNFDKYIIRLIMFITKERSFNLSILNEIKETMK